MSRILTCVALSVVGGCTLSDSATATDSLTDSTEQFVISPNGPSTTGINPDVISPNGPSAGGSQVTGIDRKGRSSTGAAITAAAPGAPMSGSDVIGSTWTGHMSDGSNISLRIDAAVQGTGSNQDVWSYRVSAWSGTAWQPLCVDDAGNPSFADSVPGTWNLQQGVPNGGSYRPTAAEFTFACRGSSVAKCVELGYKPWAGYDHELAACVRALRADYCGDGTSYTVSGTELNLYDDAGLAADTAGWTVEAAWTPEGASCVTSAQATRFSQVAHRTPSCFGTSLSAKSSCGDGFSGAVRIITELPPR